MSKVIDYANKRLIEAANNNRDSDLLYWAAYLDGARAKEAEDAEN